jgi:hypothetical protein
MALHVGLRGIPGRMGSIKALHFAFRPSSGLMRILGPAFVTSIWIGAVPGLKGALTSGRGGGSPRPERLPW